LYSNPDDKVTLREMAHAHAMLGEIGVAHRVGITLTLLTDTISISKKLSKQTLRMVSLFSDMRFS
jgi:hypothetical protein